MERDFVPCELAVSLKELGFDEPCSGHYSNGELIHSSHTNNQMQRFRYSAPTFSQAFRWFRDTHNLIHEIQIDRTSQPKFCYAILQYEHYGNYEEIRIREWYLYRTYEEAELACLENLIEVVESKSERDESRKMG